MSALTRTEKAHQKYREGKYSEALELYTDALNAASQVNHRVALHSNRQLAISSFRATSRHTGALMLRAQTLVAMKDYHSALFDVNRLP
ncbi:unnamed protein product [Sphagnum balticum]